jgi:hypothetical protein
MRSLRNISASRVTSPRLDDIEAMLAPHAFMGSFSGSSMDNGYTNASFHEGFDFPEDYVALHTPMTYGMRAFIRTRIDYVRNAYPTAFELPRIYINEAVSRNDAVIPDEFGEFEDYIELYNDEGYPIDLTGMYLSDYGGDSRRWPFASGTVLPPKGFLIIWCDDNLGQGRYHTNFKLDGDGEGVYLFGGTANGHGLVDRLIFPELDPDQAFGRFPDGSELVGVLSSPSPGESNTSGGGGSFALTVTGGCPGLVSLYASGSTPGGRVAFLAAAGTGQYTIPRGPVCVGTTLGLNSSVRVAGLVNADSLGTAVISAVVPEPLCDRIYVQALDFGTCSTTQVEGL